MNNAAFESSCLELQKHCQDLLKVKATEYVEKAPEGMEDRLSNFKTAAALLKESPEKALLGMLVKHIVSVRDMVYDIDIDRSHEIRVWREKLGDIINYCFLLYALINREEKLY